MPDPINPFAVLPDNIKLGLKVSAALRIQAAIEKLYDPADQTKNTALKMALTFGEDVTNPKLRSDTNFALAATIWCALHWDKVRLIIEQDFEAGRAFEALQDKLGTNPASKN